LATRARRTAGFIAIVVLGPLTGAALAADGGAPDERVPSRCGGDGGDVIPANLEEAIADVLRSGSPEELEKFKQHGPRGYHHGFGTSLRNCWGLWGGESPLAKWFHAHGIYHPDDMSGIVLESVHRRLLGQDIDLDGQIAYYQAYWKKERAEYEKGTNSGRLSTDLLPYTKETGWISINGKNIPFVNELYDALTKHAQPALRLCWEQIPGTPGGSAVDTIVDLVIDDQGRIERARVKETALFDRDAECLAQALVGAVSARHKSARYRVTLASYRTGKPVAAPYFQTPKGRETMSLIHAGLVGLAGGLLLLGLWVVLSFLIKRAHARKQPPTQGS